MTYVVFLVLLLLAAAYIGYPFMQAGPTPRGKRRQQGATESGTADTDSLLREIDFDYERGTLSEEARREMVARATGGRAVAQASEPLAGPEMADADEAIEREVARLRDADIERKVAALRSPAVAPGTPKHRGPSLKCLRCGAPRGRSDKFCGRCGARLTQEPRKK
ncbi:MAG: zinc ribbon domain-containing protein [Chloroflexi bacterium]|nr:zinc ribbon domain-containing protein [Chloroflexota bacterium]